MPVITVSMPVGPNAVPGVVREAVNAVTSQTFQDWRLVLVGDGAGAPLCDDVTDPRITRVRIRPNRGRYHCDAVTLAACDTPWWTVHDADDRAEPEWLEEMLSAATVDGSDVVFTAQTLVATGGRRRTVEHVVPWRSSRLVHHAHMAGLWRTDWLRAAGGPHPGFRVGWDTVMTGIPLVPGVARVSVIDDPLYTRLKRPCSLTTSRSTGMRSATRRSAVVRMQSMWPQIVIAARGGVEAAGDVVRAHVDRASDSAVRADARKLRKVMTGVDMPVAPRTGSRALELLTEDRLWSGGWPLDKGSAGELLARLDERRPHLIVEAGSGSSTLLLAAWCQENDARLVSLEHDQRWHRRTVEMLGARGLGGDAVDVRFAPLARGAGGPMYDTTIPDGVDFAVIDGPPMATGGRAAVLPALMPHMAPEWEAFLDDADRPGEQEALASWRYQFGVDTVTRGPIANITPGDTETRAGRFDAGDVAVALLTGGRNDLLTSTLDFLTDGAPGLLRSAHTIAYIHSDDRDTWGDKATVTRFIPGLDDMFATEGTPPIGVGWEQLMQCAVDSGQEYVLFLEDDWKLIAGTPDWLDVARATLDRHPEISQVRLRHARDKVLGTHMVKGTQIDWAPLPGVRALAAEAHWTFNPSLVRTEDLRRLLAAAAGCQGEMDVQRAAVSIGLRRVAQAVPGAFTHIGGGNSLRIATGAVP